MQRLLSLFILLSILALPGAAQLDPLDPPVGLILPDDLEATLWAESPMFFNPTNMDIDAQGRVWVTEAVNYRTFNNKPDTFKHFIGGDRIIVLEDADADGKAERSTVFVQDEDLTAPLGIAVIGPHVYVSSAPHLIRYTDHDGDLKPEKKEIFLTGFGGFDHDHSLHSVVAGPDGRLYFNTGNAGPHVVTDRAGWTLRSGSVYTGGSPYNRENKGAMVSDDGRVWTGGLQMRINPDGTGLEVIGHNFRNSYETYVDSYGTMWQNDNDDGVLTTRTSYLMEGGNMGFFSEDGTRTWQADRRPGQNAFTAHWHQEDPGVVPAGDNAGAGSPTGVVVYEGDALGPQYRGMLLSAEAGRNAILAYHPLSEGAGYRLESTRLITSVSEDEENYIWNDPSHAENEQRWFRPSDVAVGPDGALYVADWYDPVVGGHLMQEREGMGRIYRITPKSKTLTTPEVDVSTTEGQMAALRSPAVHVRALGAIALRRQGAVVVDQVASLLEDPNPYVQARAIHLLAELGPAGRAHTLRALRHIDPNLRIAAFRALRAVAASPSDATVLDAARQLVTDPSPAVRREVALAMRDVPLNVAEDLLFALTERYDGVDRYYLEALGIGFDGKEEQSYDRLKLRFGTGTPERWDARMARLAWRLHPVAAIGDLEARAASWHLAPTSRKEALTALGFIADQRAADAMVRLADSELPDVQEEATYWLRFRSMNTWRDYDLPILDVLAATVASDRSDEMIELYDVVRDDEAWHDVRLTAALDMVADPFGASLLLGLRNEEKLNWVVNEGVKDHIYANPSPTVRRIAVRFYENPGSRAWDVEQIARIEGAEMRGQELFFANCARCHRADDVGTEIAPDLTKVGDKYDEQTLLNQIIHPSSGIAHGFETHLVATVDGHAVYGFLQAAGETVVVMDEFGRQHGLDRANILLQTTFDGSLMPSPEEMKLSEQDLADIVSFLMNLK